MADDTKRPTGPHMWLKSREERIENLRNFLDENKEFVDFTSDANMQIEAFRAAKRRARLGGTPVPEELSSRDRALILEAEAKRAETLVKYIEALAKKEADIGKVRYDAFKALADAEDSALKEDRALREKMMTETRLSIKDMQDDYQRGREFALKLLDDPEVKGTLPGDLDRQYRVKLASKFATVYKQQNRDRAAGQTLALASFNPQELQLYIDQYANTPGKKRTKIKDLIGYDTVEEAAGHITNQHGGVMGTFSHADQGTIEAFRAGEIDANDLSGSQTALQKIDQYIEANFLDPSTSYDTNKAMQDLMSFQLALDPEKLQKLYTGEDPDNLGLLAWLKETGNLTRAKELSGFFRALNEGDHETLNHFVTSIVGSTGLSDVERSSADKIATNLATYNQTSFNPRTGQLSRASRLGHAITGSDSFKRGQADTGLSARQFMRKIANSASRHARFQRRVDVYDIQKAKQAHKAKGGYKRDIFAKTLYDIQREQNNRIEDALENPDVSDSAVALGDNTNESTATGTEQSKVGETPATDETGK
ncbi:MAG: hypothetical protein Tp1123DCM257201_11 [Prokaryotic dsDNA virus sp.]|nr:MAG: hypothetical protein Tp1123DCM257201_11 [Prokaryotic dsDNA virus sp.]